MNNVRLAGLVSRVRTTQTRIKQPMLSFTLSGITELDQDGRNIIFHRHITAFGKLAQRFAHTPDNFPIEVEGTLSVRTWTGKDGSAKRVVAVNPTSITPLPMPTPNQVDDNPNGSARLKNAANTISIAGVITRQPEFKFLPNGTAVTRIHLEVEGGSIPVDTWGEERAIETAQLAAGETILVTGVLRPMSAKDKQGDTIDTTRIEATNIELHTPPTGETEVAAGVAA